MPMRHIFMCGLFGCTEFSTLSLKRHDFRKKSIEPKMCVLIFSTNFISNVYYYKQNWARYDALIALHAKFPLFLSHFNETLILSIYFRKFSNIKFNDTLTSGSRGFPYGPTDRLTWLELSRFSKLCERAKKFSVYQAVWSSDTILYDWKNKITVYKLTSICTRLYPLPNSNVNA
jgi:hypothetical protein